MSAAKKTAIEIASRRGYGMWWKRALAGVSGVLAGLVAFAPRAAAQGCVMCYQSAAASGDNSRIALQHGILILLIPSVGLFLGIFGLIYSRRNVSR